jgi:hypothetical protein
VRVHAENLLNDEDRAETLAVAGMGAIGVHLLAVLVFTLTTPAVSPSAGVTIMVCAWTGCTESANEAPSAAPVAVALMAPRRDSRPRSGKSCDRRPYPAPGKSLKNAQSLCCGRTGPQSQLGDVIEVQILRTLHFHEARDGALELERTVASGRDRPDCGGEQMNFTFFS